MGLPLYLAMTAEEMAGCSSPPRYPALFLPDERTALPPGILPVLTDQSPVRITEALIQAIRSQSCGVLLDFEGPPTDDHRAAVKALAEVLPCPVAAPPGFIEDTRCAVFIPPCPLHVPLAAYLRPWQSREIWLDITARQQSITVTENGTIYGPTAPADSPGGLFDDTLCCQVIQNIRGDSVCFTLFDTADTIKKKLDQAKALGVSRAVGLYQELRLLL